jgi:diguanylate cyclase (GGDEF)-like protein
VPSRARRSRISLLTRFGIVSFVLLAALAGGLAQVILRSARVEAREVAERQARILLAGSGLRPDDFSQGFVPLSPGSVDRLETAIGPQRALADVALLKVWNAEHWIVYADEPRLAGRWFAPDTVLDAALAGEPSVKITTLDEAENLTAKGDFREMASLYLPVRFDAAGRLTDDPAAPVVGAFEVYLDYEPISSGVAGRARQQALLVVAGFVVLYLALFRLVASASRRLRRQAEENRHQATHDALTGLPNRRAFAEAVDAAVAASGAQGRRAAVLLADLDRFQEVNDTLGHGSGDEVLVALADRLRTGFRDDDTVAGLGGDEFGLVIGGIDDEDRARRVAAKLRALLAEPVVLAGGLSLDVHGSVGVAIAPDHGTDAAVLLQRADVAMYAAKRGHTGVEVYHPDLDHSSPLRLQLAGEVRRAIERGELFLVYQPKVDARTGVVVGAEALVRWRHPERGLVSPGDFLPAVENTELALPLTVHVLDLALAACRRWHDRGLALHVAVNVPARCLADDRLVAATADALARHGLSASQLELELTESSLLADADRARDALTRLRELGVTLAIDDFGTGYASIPYLTGLPIHVVKIDQSFVFHLHDDPQAAAVTRFSIELAHGLGLTTVAEGVEDAATVDTLRSLDCDVLQGFHLARPMPEDDLAAWLDRDDVVAATIGAEVGS